MNIPRRLLLPAARIVTWRIVPGGRSLFRASLEGERGASGLSSGRTTRFLMGNVETAFIKTARRSGINEGNPWISSFSKCSQDRRAAIHLSCSSDFPVKIRCAFITHLARDGFSSNNPNVAVTFGDCSVRRRERYKMRHAAIWRVLEARPVRRSVRLGRNSNTEIQISKGSPIYMVARNQACSWSSTADDWKHSKSAT